MAIKRKDIRDILNNENMDSDKKEKALLDLFHSEADELRDANDKLTADLAKANKDIETANAAKAKAENDLSDYKDAQAKAQAKSAKESAYKELLTAAGVSDKRISGILKLTDFDGIELDKEGKIKDEKKHTDHIKSEWSEFITDTQQRGADVPNPPSGKGKLSKSEIMSIKDTAARQQAIADNIELFD